MEICAEHEGQGLFWLFDTPHEHSMGVGEISWELLKTVQGILIWLGYQIFTLELMGSIPIGVIKKRREK